MGGIRLAEPQISGLVLAFLYNKWRTTATSRAQFTKHRVSFGIRCSALLLSTDYKEPTIISSPLDIQIRWIQASD